MSKMEIPERFKNIFEMERRFIKVIEQTNDKVYDIAMEIAKRILPFENLKHI
ncbi:hypothetical protein [Cerasibacillus terrae]|uniref:hypothetical protein n=1 Tax=Cerasibacillus terrae TaxID=2498845 RepID=UPI001746191D|nr:hypothetical protein [Cerasibacillus terrae]